MLEVDLQLKYQTPQGGQIPDKMAYEHVAWVQWIYFEPKSE